MIFYAEKLFSLSFLDSEFYKNVPYTKAVCLNDKAWLVSNDIVIGSFRYFKKNVDRTLHETLMPSLDYLEICIAADGQNKLISKFIPSAQICIIHATSELFVLNNGRVPRV